MAFLTFQNTTERIQALVMLQLILGLLYLILGVTGLASKLVHKVPVSVKTQASSLAPVFGGHWRSTDLQRWKVAAWAFLWFAHQLLGRRAGCTVLLFSPGFNKQKTSPAIRL